MLYLDTQIVSLTTNVYWEKTVTHKTFCCWLIGCFLWSTCMYLSEKLAKLILLMSIGEARFFLGNDARKQKESGLVWKENVSQFIFLLLPGKKVWERMGKLLVEFSFLCFSFMSHGVPYGLWSEQLHNSGPTLFNI